MRMIQEEWAHHRLHRPAIGVVYYSPLLVTSQSEKSIVPSSCSAFLEKLRKIIANPRPRHLFDCFLPSHQPSHCYVADLLLIGILLLLLLHTPSLTRATHTLVCLSLRNSKRQASSCPSSTTTQPHSLNQSCSRQTRLLKLLPFRPLSLLRSSAQSQSTPRRRECAR